ncbi:MAG: hypothetical protein IRY99_26095 [Isosphaeraceae bacterium]|nr:hypothetical protein [Isosphaeraceae bacterium]
MYSLLQSLCDRLDERRARRLRERYGRSGWLVSWLRLEDGSWLARLSSPDLPDTCERTGRTRSEAIRRADEALLRLLHLGMCPRKKHTKSSL